MRLLLFPLRHCFHSLHTLIFLSSFSLVILLLQRPKSHMGANFNSFHQSNKMHSNHMVSIHCLFWYRLCSVAIFFALLLVLYITYIEFFILCHITSLLATNARLVYMYSADGCCEQHMKLRSHRSYEEKNK